MARRLGGTYFPKLDDKGRLTLPAKYREHFADGVVVTRVQEGCLAVYDGSHDDVPDRQGRITLPAPLRAFAGLDHDVVVLGAGDRVEVWEPERWAQQSAHLDEVFST
jgi:MraZ protein